MGRVRRTAIAVLAALLALPALGSPVAGRAIDTRPSAFDAAPLAAPNAAPRLLVRFAAGATAAEREAALASIGATADREYPALGVTRVALPSGSDDASEDASGLLALKLARDPAVRSVEPDATGQVSFTPSDPLYGTDPQFGLGQWGLRRAQVDRAWDVVRGSPAITVAVVDTGIDANHPDLVGVALPGASFVSSPDPTCPRATTVDDNGHGTHVAGIIAASGNNGVGIAGVAFGVRILPVKALDCTGTGLLSDVAASIIWATDHGARIINISLGSNADLPTLHDAVRYATTRNVLVVTAAGNCGEVSSQCSGVNVPQYPGAYPETLSVGATDTLDGHASFSNQGSYVGISAPGVIIWSTTPTYPTTISRQNPNTQTYAAFRGTSQAAPFVAGVASLLLSQQPSLTATQAGDRLRATADDLGVIGPDPSFGAGRVNALRALSGAPASPYGATYDTSAVPGRVAPGTPFVANVRVTNSSTFVWSAAGPDPVRLGYHWYDTAGNVVLFEGQRSPLLADVAIGSTAVVPLTVVPPGTLGSYILRIDLVRDSTGWFSALGAPPASVAVSVTSGLGASYAPTAAAQSTIALGVTPFGVSVTNTGVAAWPAGGANPVHLSYHWLDPGGNVVVWDGARASLPADVGPGQAAVVTLPVASPPAPGVYVLRLDLVQEGIAWFSAQGVAPRDLQISVTSGFAATYTLGSVPALLPGGRMLVPISIRNDGLASWSATGPTPVHLSAHLYDGVGRLIVWDGERTTLQADVAPGATATAAVAVNAPLVPGSYVLRVDLVQEGVAWFSSYGVATANAALIGLPDYRAGISVAAGPISRTAPAVLVTLTNTGTATWTPAGAAPVDLSSHWLASDGRVLLWEGPRAVLPAVAPGATVTLTLPLASPPPGATLLVVDPVSEGVRWFGVGSPIGVTLVP